MAKDSIKADVEERATKAILTSAFFSWPSAVTIVLFVSLFLLQIPLAFLSFWASWMWLLVGAGVEGIYLLSTLTDPEASRQAVSRMLAEKYDPHNIRNLNARQQMQRALEYKVQIDKFISVQSGAMRETMRAVSSEINDWIAYIYKLAMSIDTFEGNTIIARDRQNVPTQIANLKRRLAAEQDPRMKTEITEAIQIRQKLLDNLNNIAKAAERAEIQMENTVAQLSTVYAQMQLMDSKDIDSGRTKRLQADIHEEIAQLNDTLKAMDDFYQQQGYNSAVDKLSDSSTGAEADSSSNTADDIADASASQSNKRS